MHDQVDDIVIPKYSIDMSGAFIATTWSDDIAESVWDYVNIEYVSGGLDTRVIVIVDSVDKDRSIFSQALNVLANALVAEA